MCTDCHRVQVRRPVGTAVERRQCLASMSSLFYKRQQLMREQMDSHTEKAIPEPHNERLEGMEETSQGSWHFF